MNSFIYLTLIIMGASEELPKFNKNCLAGYHPTEGVYDEDIIAAETIAYGRVHLSGEASKIRDLGEELLVSLKRTVNSGQPVEGSILTSSNPLDAICQYIREVAFEASQEEEEEEQLPEGVHRVTIQKSVSRGFLVKNNTGGKNMIFMPRKKGEYKSGMQDVLVRETGKTDPRFHRRIVVEYIAPALPN
jgi:hypothetical protein